MTGDPKPEGRPMYELLGNAGATLTFIEENGGAVFEQALKDEIREAMNDLGVRVVLWYGERMDDVSSVWAEFSTT